MEEELQHGWPFVYSCREFEEFYSNGFETSNVWTPWSSVTEFSFTALILDVVIALVIAATISSVFQFRRLRRTRLLQFRLIDGFIAVTAIAAVVAWSHGIYDSDRRELLAIQQLNIQTLRPRDLADDPMIHAFLHSQFANAVTESQLPTWFDNLRIFPRCRNIVGLNTTITNDEQAALLGNFRRLRYLYLSANNKVDLSFLEHTHQLRVFYPPMNFNDEDARHLSHLTKLEELSLSHTKLSDSAMVHLSGLPNLKSLKLSDRVSRDGLRNIEELTNLKVLHLPHRMESNNLEFLRRLTSLRELRLSWGISRNALSDLRHLTKLKQIEYLPMDLDDDGLKNLKELINLEHLRLDKRSITDDGLHHLASLTKLKFLDLSETQISDAGLANLSGLTELEFLDLSETEISDDGLTYLAGLKELKNVWLYRTHVTDEGVELLRKAMPDLRNIT